MDRKRIAFCTIVSVAWAIVLFFPQTTYLQDTYIFTSEAQFPVLLPSVIKAVLCFAGILCIVIFHKALNKTQDLRMRIIQNKNVLPLLIYGTLCLAEIILLRFNKTNDSLILVSPLFYNSFLCVYCLFRINIVLSNADKHKKLCIKYGQVAFIILYVVWIVRPFLYSHNLYNLENNIDPETYYPMYASSVLMMSISNVVTVYQKENERSGNNTGSMNNGRFLLYIFMLLSFFFALSKVMILCSRLTENEDCWTIYVSCALIFIIAYIVGGVVFTRKKYNDSKLIRALLYYVLVDVFIEVILMNGYSIQTIEMEGNYRISNALTYNFCPAVCCMAILFSCVLVDSSEHILLGRTCLYCLTFGILLLMPPISLGNNHLFIFQYLSVFFPVVLGLVILLKNRYGNAVQKEKML